MPGSQAADIDMVICAASHHQRPYPAIAIEIQHALGIEGAAFDMGLGCSSAAAGLHVAFNLVRTGAQRRVLVVTPEIITAHLNFRDRQTHFIFGDASTAMVVRAARRGRDAAGTLRDRRHPQLDAVLQQYPHQFRLPGARRPGRHLGRR